VTRLYPSPIQSVVTKLVILLAVALVAFSMGCVPAHAIRQARWEAAKNRADAEDPTNNNRERAMGRSNWIAWEVQLEALTGDEPSADIAAEVSMARAVLDAAETEESLSE
jgi:hypothetical protein